MSKVLRTKSGLFIREDIGFGLIVYSPYSGLFFACSSKDSPEIKRWLQLKGPCPSREYNQALGIGWCLKKDNIDYPVHNLLPSTKGVWEILPNPKGPVVINWLLTGNCPLACRYCYAEDLMRGKCPEPSVEQVKSIARGILSYNPLVVVLTGGDPLFSPHLEKAMKILHGHAGLIIDTCGFTFTRNHSKLFKQYNAFVRVSLDSQIPRINDGLRPISRLNSALKRQNISTVTRALTTICHSLEDGVNVAVQTVATRINYNDFQDLGDKLARLGVKGWREILSIGV